MTRPVVYLAAPLFNVFERSRNLALALELDVVADVFLPQRDGSLLADMVAAGVPVPVAERRVFEQDCVAMQKCDALIAILDGAHIDEGVAYEIGFVSALGRQCVGLQTDARRALPTGNNPMITGALTNIFADTQSLYQWLSSCPLAAASTMPILRA